MKKTLEVEPHAGLITAGGLLHPPDKQAISHSAICIGFFIDHQCPRGRRRFSLRLRPVGNGVPLVMTTLVIYATMVHL